MPGGNDAAGSGRRRKMAKLGPQAICGMSGQKCQLGMLNSMENRLVARGLMAAATENQIGGFSLFHGAGVISRASALAWLGGWSRLEFLRSDCGSYRACGARRRLDLAQALVGRRMVRGDDRWLHCPGGGMAYRDWGWMDCHPDTSNRSGLRKTCEDRPVTVFLGSWPELMDGEKMPWKKTFAWMVPWTRAAPDCEFFRIRAGDRNHPHEHS